MPTMTTREPLLPSIDEPPALEPPMLPIEPAHVPAPTGFPLNPKDDRRVQPGGRHDPAPACAVPRNPDHHFANT